MSLNTEQSIRCPKCGQMKSMTVWQSVRSEDTDLKSDILKRKLNIFECDICGAQALYPEPLLYTDDDKKLMITFAPCSDNDTSKKMYEEIRDTSRKSGELENLSGYNLRFVSDYNDLMEKILIFDNELNDKVIEFIKMLILSQEPDKAAKRKIIFGKKENNEIEFLVQDMSDGMMYTSKVPMLTYDTVLEQLKQTGVKMYSFDWEIVNTEYASKLLSGVNNNL